MFVSRRILPAVVLFASLFPSFLVAGTGSFPGSDRAIEPAVVASLRRSEDYLRSIQRPDGTWLGLVESDARVTALYLLTARAVERVDPERFASVERYLASMQHPSGYFEAYPGGGPDLSTTRLVTIALEQTVSTQGSEVRTRALHFLEQQGELPPPDIFVMTYGAVAGEVPWSRVPYVSPRLVALPDWFHPNLYDVNFLRIALVPLALLRGHPEDGSPRAPLALGEPVRPGDARPPERGVLDKAADWVKKGLLKGLWHGVTRMSRVADKLLPPMDARRLAAEWIMERREADGSFGGTFQATSLAIIALHREDPERYRDVVDAGLEALHAWQVEDERGTWQQFCDSVVWDTATSVRALLAMGVPPEDPQIQAAAEFLVSMQSDVRGDWSKRAPDLEPGGWGFERYNTWYPDLDDTALVVSTLLQVDVHGRWREEIARGVRWVLGLQNKDGGWAAWDRDDRGFSRLPEGGGWIVGDPSYSDLTGRVVTALAPLAVGVYPGYDDLRRPVKKALREAYGYFMEHRHGPAWFGWWFVHYIHGTAEVLEGLHMAGVRHEHPAIQEAVEWLKVIQNPDGGFGESQHSATDGHFVGKESTVQHTAYALKALVSGGEADSEAARRAAGWLVEAQEESGQWVDPDWSGVGIPGLWYSRYHLSPCYTVALALRGWLDAVNGVSTRPTARR